MDHAKSRIAVLHRFHDDPHSKQIIDLINRLILIHHFLINTEKMLHASADLCLNARVSHMSGYVFYDLVNKLLPLCLSGIDLLY